MLYPQACIIAADTQEIAGSFKRDVRKIDALGIWGLIEGIRAVVVSGAGYAPFADAVAADIRKRFDKGPSAHDQMISLVERELKAFYKKHIDPVIAQDPRVDIGLVVASNHDGQYGLLSTGRTAARFAMKYTAVGVGSAVAFPLLELLYDALAPLDAAILTASYVVWKAKRSVDGVGHFTDITVLLPRHVLEIPRSIPQRWELAFEQIDRLNAATSRYVFDFRAPAENRPIKVNHVEEIARIRTLLQRDAQTLAMRIAELTGWAWKIEAAKGTSL